MDEQTPRQGERPQLVAVDELVPCVPVDDPPTLSGPPGLPGASMTASGGRLGHPSGLNREQRRAAYARHKAASRDRRLAEQARQARKRR